MAKLRKDTRCKKFIIHRAPASCSGTKGKKACHAPYVLVKGTKYASMGKGGFGLLNRQATVCPRYRGNKKVLTTSTNVSASAPGSVVALRKLGGKKRAPAGSWKNKQGKDCHTVCR
jgi:hypothetical protein